MKEFRTKPGRMIGTPHGLAVADRTGRMSVSDAQAEWLRERTNAGLLHNLVDLGEQPVTPNGNEHNSSGVGGCTDAPAGGDAGSRDAPTKPPAKKAAAKKTAAKKEAAA